MQAAVRPGQLSKGHSEGPLHPPRRVLPGKARKRSRATGLVSVGENSYFEDGAIGFCTSTSSIKPYSLASIALMK